MICTNINLSDQDEVSICSILVCLVGETLGDIQTPRILKAQEVFLNFLCGPDIREIWESFFARCYLLAVPHIISRR